MNVISLQTLIKTIKSSIIRSTKVLEQHHLTRLNDYFNEDGTPKTVELVLDGKKCQVPAFTLVNHQTLTIDGLEMEFKARLFDYELPKDWGYLLDVLRLLAEKDAELKSATAILALFISKSSLGENKIK